MSIASGWVCQTMYGSCQSLGRMPKQRLLYLSGMPAHLQTAGVFTALASVDSNGTSGSHVLYCCVKPGKHCMKYVVRDHHAESCAVHVGREHKRQAIKDEPIFSGQAARGARQKQTSAQRTESSLRVRGGVKGKSTLDKAALLSKRRRMDASVKLGMSSPGMRN